MFTRRTHAMYFILSILITLLLTSCSLLLGKQDAEPTQMVVAVPVKPTEQVETEVPALPENATQEPTTETTVLAETEQPTVLPEQATATAVVHNVTPGEISGTSKFFFDTDSSTSAANKTATGGDDYLSNKYERPFSETDMVYLPDLDILKAEIAQDENFYYITITVKGLNPTSKSLTGTYGAELDYDLDGRGDFLFYCDLPNYTDWKIDTVHAFEDRNNDVGGSRPTYPESGLAGNGYETLIFSTSLLDDPDGMWCRQRPGSEAKVDLAIHKPLIGSPVTFAWGVWADLGVKQPGRFAYNDYFTFEEAGSPISGNSFYPLKALHSLDNTCREAFGFDPTIEIPGMCFVLQPTPTTQPQPTTVSVRPGTVSGIAFQDANNDGIRQSTDPEADGNYTISLYQGPCSSGLHVVYRSTTNKTFSFTVPAGEYCLFINPKTYMTTPSQYSITITSSGHIYKDFGFQWN